MVTFIYYLYLSTTTYTLEGKHLVIKRGIFNTREDVYEFETVRSAEVDQTLLGRLFHYGTIILKSSASGGYNVMVQLSGIPNPFEFEKMIDNQI